MNKWLPSFLIWSGGFLLGMAASDFYEPCKVWMTKTITDPEEMRVVGTYKLNEDKTIVWEPVEMTPEEREKVTCLHTKPAGRGTYTLAIPEGETCVTILGD